MVAAPGSEHNYEAGSGETGAVPAGLGKAFSGPAIGSVTGGGSGRAEQSNLKTVV